MISINERGLILKWKKEGKSQQDIAELLGCNQSSVSRLLVKYKKKGTIMNLPRSGRPTPLDNKTQRKLKKEIEEKIKEARDSFSSISTKQVRVIIQNKLNKLYSPRHIERIMHKLGFSLITPRPQHVRHNQEKVDSFREEFKKNSIRSTWIMN